VLAWTVAGGLVLGVAAIVLGVLWRGRVRRREADNGGMAVAGIVLGALGVLAAVAVIAAGVALFSSDSGRSLVDCLQDAETQADVEECQREFESDLGS
jgi:heme/copper-type cytochrome/quinol oxidase subunit 2